MHFLSGCKLPLTTFITSVLVAGCGGSNSSTSADTVKPTLTLNSQSNPITNQTTINLSGVVTDNQDINGLMVTVKNNATGKTVTSTTNASGEFTASVPLQAGANDIVVTVSDKSGNQATTSMSLTVDNVAPTLTLNADVKDEFSRTTLTKIAGKVADDRELTEIDATITLDNTNQTLPLTLNAQGDFTSQLNLKPGQNNFTITVMDKAGNRQTQQGSIYFGQTLAAGNSHTASLKDGKLYAWGRNNFGQVGMGITTSLSQNDNHPISPLLISQTPTDIASIVFNQNHSALLTKSGKVYTWGDDRFGQLGRGALNRSNCASGNNNCRLDMAEVAGLSNVVSIASGYRHHLALDADGKVYAFGQNSNGQLGVTNTTTSDVPVQVNFSASSTMGKVIQVAAAANSSYALDDKGQVWAWGQNQYGNLGQGNVCVATAGCQDVNNTPILVKFPAGVNITEIAAGKDHVLAMTDQGKVYAWGLNASSQVGFNGEGYKDSDRAWAQYVTTPILLPWFDNRVAKHVYANGNTSYVMLNDRKVYAWGTFGETDATGKTIYVNLNEPTDKLPALTNVTDMSVGALHQIAQRQDGGLYTWGWSFEGSLGGGATTTNIWMYNVPIAIKLP